VEEEKQGFALGTVGVRKRKKKRRKKKPDKWVPRVNGKRSKKHEKRWTRGLYVAGSRS
jgi:hypothetical protein